MRLRRLELARYGHLTGVGLDFSDSAGVHVLLGPNEAGKSTALAAIADALFGFGHRTEYDFLHGGPQLRLGFSVRAADGRDGDFWRRKGRGQTLRDGTDRPVGEEALRPFLGGTTRQMFEQAFGLNGERLRQGAAALLRSGGEAGESLLAGLGLMHLRAVASDLDDAAKAQAGAWPGLRRLSGVAETWRRANQAAQAAAVRPAAWAEAAAEHERLKAELVAVQARSEALAREQSRLERVRRVRVPVAQLDTAREALAAVADAPRLPDDVEERRRQWADQARDARRDHEREMECHRAAAEQREAVALDPAVLSLEAEIVALVARCEGARGAERDLPEVEEEVAEQAAIVREAGLALGSSTSPEALREALPAAPVRRGAQRAVDARIKAAARIAPAAEASDRARRERDRIKTALDAAPALSPVDHLRRAVDDAKAEAKVDGDLADAERDFARVEADARAALHALPLWHGDAAALKAAPVPLEAEARGLGEAVIRAASALEAADGEATKLRGEVAALDAAVALLVQVGLLPTRGAVATARAARDALWQTIRRRLDGVEPEITTAGLPERFEVAQDAADRLADRRADEAGRVAEYELKTEQLAVLRQRLAAAEAKVAIVADAAGAAGRAWAALWAPCGIAPSTPEAMAEWRRDRAEVLKLVALAAQARARRDGLAALRDRALALLRSLFPALPPEAGLGATLALAEAACRTSELAVAARAQLVGRLADAERGLEEATASLRQAQADLDATGPDWDAALATFGLPGDASIEAAQAAQIAWARIAEAAKLWRSDESRVDKMRTEIAGFDAAVRAMQGRLGAAADDAASAILLDAVDRRLTAARAARDKAATLTERIAGHAQAAAAAERLLHEADRELSDLRALAHAEDDAALAEAIIRARRRAEHEMAIAGLERQLAELGDGRREAALREEVAAIDADAAPARLEEIESDRATLGSRRETLATEIAAASGRLAAMAAGGDAAARAQEAEDALAEARAAAERYARLHVARALLQAGIERFRRANQGPLLQAAGENFRTLTHGRYVRLAVEGGDKEPLIHAVRPDGEECPVAALSEGTRDQLYLALRVAAIQGQVAASEPLPFVADDLLVQFDDARAAAAIGLLSQLGRQTQVLLFTHHRHMADLAASHAGVDVQAWPS